MSMALQKLTTDLIEASRLGEGQAFQIRFSGDIAKDFADLPANEKKAGIDTYEGVIADVRDRQSRQSSEVNLTYSDLVTSQAQVQGMYQILVDFGYESGGVKSYADRVQRYTDHYLANLNTDLDRYAVKNYQLSETALTVKSMQDQVATFKASLSK